MSLRDTLSAERSALKRRLRDIRHAFTANRHGVPLALAWQIVGEARGEGIARPLAFALIEQEVGGHGWRNVFGCDHYPAGRDDRPPYCGQKVTRKRANRFFRWQEDTGGSNGIGPAQLTYPPFQREAELEGGVHRTRPNVRVGLRVLRRLIVREGSKREGVRAYNGSGPAAERYADEVLKREREWKERLK